MVTRFKNPDNSFETRMWSSFYLCIWLLPYMAPYDHGRVRQIHSYVPHSHAFWILWCLRLLCLEYFLIASFTLEIWFRFFHPKFPFVWVMIHLSSQTEKNLLSNPFILLIYFFSISSWYILSVLEFWHFILSLLSFILWHGIILNTIHLSVLLPLCGSLVEIFLG